MGGEESAVEEDEGEFEGCEGSHVEDLGCDVGLDECDGVFREDGVFA